MEPTEKEKLLIKNLSQINNLEAHSNDFYLDNFVLSNPTFKRNLCRIARLKNLEVGKFYTHQCPFKGKEYDCDNCPQLYDQYINRRDYTHEGKATTSCIADALGESQQMMSYRLKSKKKKRADFAAIAAISYLAECSILDLLKLPDQYLFSKIGVVVNVDKKYSIPKLATKLRKAKELLQTNNLKVDSKNMIVQLKLFLPDFEIDAKTIDEILNNYIF